MATANNTCVANSLGKQILRTVEVAYDLWLGNGAHGIGVERTYSSDTCWGGVEKVGFSHFVYNIFVRRP